jgi:hypothetical protein
MKLKPKIQLQLMLEEFRAGQEAMQENDEVNYEAFVINFKH